MAKTKPSWRLPKFRSPFANPLDIKTLQRRLFTKRKPKFTWRKALRFTLWTVGLLILFVVFLFAWFAKDLPTPGKIRNLASSGSTRLFDRHMKPLYTISGEKKRIIVESKDIPEVVREATIAIEDKDFYRHHGIYLRGVARAVVFGGRRGGGSTITQQFVKNALLTSQHSLVRKAKEAILAVELEALYSKDEILTMYLNEIPYGGNNYGIEAAARSFFAKSASKLTIAEAATLASLPQAPTTLSPYGSNVDQLLARRNYIIGLMLEQGYINDKEAKSATASKIKVGPKRDDITAPHFVLYVKEWLVKHFTEELGDAQLAEQRVEEGGLTVVTTLDLEKQLAAEAAMARSKPNLAFGGASNAGLVSIDPKRGEILAMVGSVDYFQKQFGAFNVTTADRQPGSSFKPIVYATAFKEKFSPSSNLFDLRTDFGNYVPQNYDGGFRGPISIRKALGNSLNIPAVKVLSLIGVDKALETAHDMGITTLNDRDRYGLSLVLGGGEVKLVDLTTAYGVFANQGVLMPNTPILKITDTKGKELYSHENPRAGRQVLDPQIAYEITSILSDVDAKMPIFAFSIGNLTLPGRPAATKTGTTDEYRDAWTIGYTPQLVTGVWAGNNDNTPMNNFGGSAAAAPIWHDYMAKVHEGLPVKKFTRPSGIKDVTVDRLSNRLPVNGSERIRDIFASWQIPTENDNVHLRVRVCKENGLLADSSIPDNLARLKTFVSIRSERPDYPNWEGPVLAWARSHGFNNPPPTESCRIGSNQPSVSITAPSNGQTVSGAISIRASASAPSGVKRVEFSVDQVGINSDSSAPYRVSYNVSALSNGDHTITATVVSKSGATSTDSITIKVSNDTTPPGNVSNLVCLPQLGGGAVALSWVNPGDADLKLLRIYVFLFPSLDLHSTVEVTAPGNSSTISSLSAGSYQFTVKSVDTVGNESSGSSCIVTVT